MKLGDLVRVSKSVWKLSDRGTFEGQVGACTATYASGTWHVLAEEDIY